MCVVSNVIDDFTRRWPSPTPGTYPNTPYAPTYPTYPTPPQLTKEELEALRDLIKAAQKYDDATGQPDCESDDKIAKLKSILINYLALLDGNEDCDAEETATDLVDDIAELLDLDLRD